MKRECLKLIPTKYLCPWCREWHRYNWSRPLEYYDSKYDSLTLKCRASKRTLLVYFSHENCFFYFEGDDIKFDKPISEFTEIDETHVSMYEKFFSIEFGFEFKWEDYKKIYFDQIAQEYKQLSQMHEELIKMEKSFEEKQNDLMKKMSNCIRKSLE